MKTGLFGLGHKTKRKDWEVAPSLYTTYQFLLLAPSTCLPLPNCNLRCYPVRAVYLNCLHPHATWFCPLCEHCGLPPSWVVPHSHTCCGACPPHTYPPPPPRQACGNILWADCTMACVPCSSGCTPYMRVAWQAQSGAPRLSSTNQRIFCAHLSHLRNRLAPLLRSMARREQYAVRGRRRNNL